MTGGINRPPMERSRGTVRLYRKAQELAAELGFALEEASTGGGSDGNFTAALGIPTLDGMGAVGEGAHARHESMFIEHLAPAHGAAGGHVDGLMEHLSGLINSREETIGDFHSHETLLF